MGRKLQLRFAGYGPATTCFSAALKQIGDRLERQFYGELEVKYVYNIMDLGYRSEDIIWLAESGIVSLGYQSSSYLSDRVPELGLVDLPFVFRDKAHAREAMDGALGAALTRAIEARCDFRVLGWLENGFRHLSNRVRPVRRPADMTGMTIRVLPSEVHAATFAALGAVPRRLDLTEALADIAAGRIDAQENPLANTVTYGAHKFHPFHTLLSHFYISRPVFVHRLTFDAMSPALQRAFREAVGEAVAVQRRAAELEEIESAAAIEAAGCRIERLSGEEQAAFEAAVRPYKTEAFKGYDRAFAALVA